MLDCFDGLSTDSMYLPNSFSNYLCYKSVEHWNDPNRNIPDDQLVLPVIVAAVVEPFVWLVLAMMMPMNCCSYAAMFSKMLPNCSNKFLYRLIVTLGHPFDVMNACRTVRKE